MATATNKLVLIQFIKYIVSSGSVDCKESRQGAPLRGICGASYNRKDMGDCLT